MRHFGFRLCWSVLLLMSGCRELICGNGVIQPGETCDDANNTDGDGCDSNCTLTACGNGIITQGEACEDGNLANGDGCSNNCQEESGFTCTDTPQASPPSSCAPICGDNTLVGDEECDDGNQDTSDACPLCKNAFCGDGFVQSGAEGCDDSNQIDADGCEADCSLPACNNGVVDPGEICFLSRIFLVTSLPNNPQFIAVSDLDQDGIRDIVVTIEVISGLGRVTPLLGNGDGTFSSFSSIDVEKFSTEIAVGELNGDGLPDLAIEHNSGVTLLFGDGLGDFPNQQELPISAAFSVAVADLNQDTNDDLILSGIRVLLGNGDGTFQPEQAFSSGGSSSLTIRDLNADGDLDVVGAGTNVGANFISVLLGNGDGTLGPEQRFPTGDNPNAIVVIDLNGDSVLDLAATNNADNTISILLGNGDGTFQAQKQVFSPGGPNRLSMAAGDFNGDSTIDLATALPEVDLVSILSGNGDGTFLVEQTFLVGNSPQFLVAEDVDQDGISDLAVINTGGASISMLLSNGALP